MNMYGNAITPGLGIQYHSVVITTQESTCPALTQYSSCIPLLFIKFVIHEKIQHTLVPCMCLLIDDCGWLKPVKPKPILVFYLWMLHIVNLLLSEIWTLLIMVMHWHSITLWIFTLVNMLVWLRWHRNVLSRLKFGTPSGTICGTNGTIAL